MFATFTTACVLVFAPIPTAYAVTVDGAYSAYFGPHVGKEYRNRSTISNNSTALVASSRQEVRSGTVPAGYMGILPRLYKGTAICRQNSDYQYNGGSGITAYIVALPNHGCGGGNYHYSYGVTKAYNGNGYSAYFTPRSPNLTY